MTSPQTPAEALVVLTWHQENSIFSDSVKKVNNKNGKIGEVNQCLY